MLCVRCMWWLFSMGTWDPTFCRCYPHCHWPAYFGQGKYLLSLLALCVLSKWHNCSYPWCPTTWYSCHNSHLPYDLVTKGIYRNSSQRLSVLLINLLVCLIPCPRCELYHDWNLHKFVFIMHLMTLLTLSFVCLVCLRMMRSKMFILRLRIRKNECCSLNLQLRNSLGQFSIWIQNLSLLHLMETISLLHSFFSFKNTILTNIYLFQFKCLNFKKWYFYFI